MNARAAAYTIIDFETTGTVKGLPEEPWQIGMAKLDAGAYSPDTYTTHLRIGNRPFNPYAPGRHAEQRAELAAAPTCAESWPHWMPWLQNRILVAHNAGTEKKILRHIMPMHHWPHWIDTLHLSRRIWPGLPSYTLADICHHAALIPLIRTRCPDRDWHDALFDAIATATLLEWLLALPDWHNLPLAALLTP